MPAPVSALLRVLPLLPCCRLGGWWLVLVLFVAVMPAVGSAGILISGPPKPLSVLTLADPAAPALTVALLPVHQNAQHAQVV